MTSEERLRREIIKEMEETWRDEDTNIEEQTLLKRISNQLRSFPARSKAYFTGFREMLRKKNSPHSMTKVDSQTTINNESSSENLPSEDTNDIQEALVEKRISIHCSIDEQ